MAGQVQPTSFEQVITTVKKSVLYIEYIIQTQAKLQSSCCRCHVTYQLILRCFTAILLSHILVAKFPLDAKSHRKQQVIQVGNFSRTVLCSYTVNLDMLYCFSPTVKCAYSDHLFILKQEWTSINNSTINRNVL